MKPQDHSQAASQTAALDAARTEQFVQLLARHRSELYRFIFTLVPDKVESDDILQQTSVVLWRKFADFDPQTDFVRWATRVAHFEVRDFRKRQARDRHRFFSDDLIELIAATRAEEDPSFAERRQALAQCIDRLSAQDRRILDGRYAPGSTIQGLSQQLDQPANTLYKSLNRIRRTLTTCVERTLREP